MPANILQQKLCPPLPAFRSSSPAMQEQPIRLKYLGDSAVTKHHRRQGTLQVHSGNLVGLDSNQVSCSCTAMGAYKARHNVNSTSIQSG